MGIADKFEAKKDQVKGSAKEAVGKATDDDSLTAEGKIDKAKGGLKEAAENVKDTVKDVLDK